MSRIRVHGIELEYEDMGPREAPAILLVMGLGMQLVAWPDPFCEALVARGFRVIRFDNRDAGLSTGGSGSLRAMRWKLALTMLRLPVRPPYTLDDMAEDTLGLLDGLGLKRAHVVGASMGGMIAQLLAIRHPERVASLTSMMSTTGRRGLPGPKPEVRRAMLRRRPKTRAAAIDFAVDLLRVIGSPGYPSTDAYLRGYAGRAVARAFRPDSFARQLVAIVTAPSRVAALRRLKVPTLVLHGADDPLLPLPAGQDTAAAIPGARLVVIPGWGHDLPEALLPVFAERIADHCAAAEGARA